MTDKAKKYRVNEIFYSVQGEGIRQGTANVFVRFSGCNLKCAVGDEHSGFDCDTEFVSGVWKTLDELLAEIILAATDHVVNGEKSCKAVILTGGEPGMQIDQPLVDELHKLGFYVAIETNGTYELPTGIDWVCCSPKSAEHTLKLDRAHELKYVRHVGQGIPRPSIKADNLLISPAFNPDWSVNQKTVDHCIGLVKKNPVWRLSVQMHKLWGVR